jgi:lysophospholipase L1-like esterase
MRVSYLSLFQAVLAAASPHTLRAEKPVHWLLAGDSTTAPGGGWGDGFLSTTVAPGSSGFNHARGGTTTASFRAGGDWGRVIKDIGTNKAAKRVYVTIQVKKLPQTTLPRPANAVKFGHNDQKPTSGVTLAAYKTNLAAFAAEAKKAGATPILLTSLTRRTFSGGKVVENLSNERAATIEVANANSLHWIDLNQASTKYVNAIGSAAADKYNLAAGDRTHVNQWGGVVFARLVSDLLVAKYPGEFQSVTVKNQTLSQLIAAGKPA